MDATDEKVIPVSLEDLRALLLASCERAHSEHNVPLEATDAIASLADLEPDGFRYAILFLARIGVVVDNALNRAWAAQQAMH